MLIYVLRRRPEQKLTPKCMHIKLTCKSIADKKGKAVPLHAMKEFGGRGGIAPTHS
jgi:hypothetical protein